jgi:hypothetical protein
MSIPVNFFITQGEDWFDGVNFNHDDNSPYDLTGVTFQAPVKNSYQANSVADFTITVINAPAGNATISMNAAVSSNLSAGKYLYNVMMLDAANNTTKIFGGLLTILPSTSVTAPNNGLPPYGIS